MKKVLAATAAVLILLLSVISVSADEKPVMVALGDSIAAGYGLEDRSLAYCGILAKKLGAELLNLARDGTTTAGLLDRLDRLSPSEKETLKKAKYVAISVGGNDLVGEKNRSDFMIEEAVKAASDENYVPSDKVKEALATLESNLGKIFDEVHTLAPDAKILAQTTYNPYLAGNFKNIGKVLTVFTDGINEACVNAVQGRNYVILTDVAAEMNGVAKYFNASDTPLGIDFHPTIHGHIKMANMIYESIMKIQNGTVPSSEPTVTGCLITMGGGTWLAAAATLLSAGAIKKKK